MNRKSRKIRKISLFLGIAVAALSVGVPTALAKGGFTGSQEPDGVAVFKANEMATLSQQNVSPLSTYRDTSQSGAYQIYKLYGSAPNALDTYRDAASRTVVDQSVPLSVAVQKRQFEQFAYGISRMAEAQLQAATVNNGILSTYRDAGQRAVPQPQSPNVTPTSSDNDIQWPQIGVGILIALFLALGIGLAVRTNRMRPAH